MKYIFIAAAFGFKPSGMKNNALVTVIDAVAETERCLLTYCIYEHMQKLQKYAEYTKLT